MKKGKVVVAVLIVLMIAIISLVCAVTVFNPYARAISAGNKYLEEGKYQEAILEFNRALEIDDSRYDAYSGLFKAYTGLDDESTPENISALAERCYNLHINDQQLFADIKACIEAINERSGYLIADSMYQLTSDNSFLDLRADLAQRLMEGYKERLDQMYADNVHTYDEDFESSGYTDLVAELNSDEVLASACIDVLMSEERAQQAVDIISADTGSSKVGNRLAEATQAMLDEYKATLDEMYQVPFTLMEGPEDEAEKLRHDEYLNRLAALKYSKPLVLSCADYYIEQGDRSKAADILSYACQFINDEELIKRRDELTDAIDRELIATMFSNGPEFVSDYPGLLPLSQENRVAIAQEYIQQEKHAEALELLKYWCTQDENVSLLIEQVSSAALNKELADNFSAISGDPMVLLEDNNAELWSSIRSLIENPGDKFIYMENGAESGKGIGFYNVEVTDMHRSYSDYFFNKGFFNIEDSYAERYQRTFVYVGDYVGNVRSGNGKWIELTYKWSVEGSPYEFEGAWANDMPNGFGQETVVEYEDDRVTNSGNLVNGLWSGKINITTEGIFQQNLSVDFSNCSLGSSFGTVCYIVDNSFESWVDTSGLKMGVRGFEDISDIVRIGPDY